VIKHTPYYHRLVAAGAKFQDRAGFATANFFTSVEEEHRAVRERVGMFDVFYQVAVEIKGAAAHDLLQRVLVNDVRRLTDGGVMYSPICNEDGGIVDDLTCFRLGKDRFWLSPAPSRVGDVVEHVERYADNLPVCVTNLGYKNAYLSLQGPRSRDVLGALSDSDLATGALPYFTCTRGTVAGVSDVLISRTGYSGELGYELFFPVEYAEHIWDTIYVAGERFGIRPCGMKAMRSLRIEKMYVLYGLDISTSTDPLSAGLGWTVRFDDREFVGRSALERIRRDGPLRRLCLLDAGGLYPIRHGEAVFKDGVQIGTVTSGDPGYSFGRTFAFAYLPAACANSDTEVQIVYEDGKASANARVTTRPPYDPNRLRARA
jgi:aminomethyltransferase